MSIHCLKMKNLYFTWVLLLLFVNAKANGQFYPMSKNVANPVYNMGHICQATYDSIEKKITVNSIYTQPAANTYSTTAIFPAVMMGLKGSIKPIKNGRVFVLVTLSATNSIAIDGCVLSIAYGTGVAPNTNAAFIGASAGGTSVLQKAETILSLKPMTIQSIISGLSIGTTYWIDLVMSSYNGGISTFSNVNMSLIEL